jgi:hypothetical protein
LHSFFKADEINILLIRSYFRHHHRIRSNYYVTYEIAIDCGGEIQRKTSEAAGTLVADLSYDRPNVYYELGYTHRLGRDEEVILLAKKDSTLHSDDKDLNVFFYRGIKELESGLEKRLDAIGRNSDSVFPF